MKSIAFPLASAVLFSSPVNAESVLSPDGTVRTFIVRQRGQAPDPSKAVPMRLPRNSKPLPSLVDMQIAAAKLPSFSPGRVFPGGVGAARPGVRFEDSPGVVMKAAASGGGVGSQDYGTSGQPYTMARAEGATLPPYRQAGLLFFNDGGSSPGLCSAALIKPGIVVTAAHCIVPYGTTNYFAGETYLPAWGPDGASKYGIWNAARVSVLSSWTAGTDSCSTPATVCQNDVGIITLAPDGSGKYAGAYTGWFGYSTNNYSSSSGQFEITQLGYSAGYDGGNVMLRTESQGSLTGVRMSRNIVIGSPLGDSSDGGPWVVNFGIRSLLTTSLWSYGNAPAHNIVVGVTSWSTGTGSGQQQAGSSSFTSANIGTLVSNACSATPAACATP